MRVLRWQARAAAGQLDDLRPGSEQAAHALLGWEREAIWKLAEEWGEIDRSHRKLAHRGSRLRIVHASELTVLRVLAGAGMHLPGAPPREPRPARPWPEWAELMPGVIWIYDFTRAKRCAVAVLDVVSRYWLATIVSVEESSTQVEVAFTRALIEDGKKHLLDDDLLAELASGEIPEGDDRLPVLLAISDNGPQMTKATAAFMAGARIAQHFGRPSTPDDQAWVESFSGHLKGEFPHLEKTRDPGELEAELDRLRIHYNTIRLHEGIGYVTPRRRASRPRPRHPRRPPRRTRRSPQRQGCGPPSATAGSPVSPRQWPGIAPENWCILSDAPRPARPRHPGVGERLAADRSRR